MKGDGIIGWTVVDVLPEIIGRPWCEVTKAYLRALRPSEVRVIEHNGVMKTDAVTWRVTVQLTALGRVAAVHQEVEVDLPSGIAHGYALGRTLDMLEVEDIERSR